MTLAARATGAWHPGRFALLGDERLARLVAAGHERAFAVVYERYHQTLYRYCRSILRNDADAQDALQSTFAAAFAALRRGQRDAPMRPWLFRIAHNAAVSALRQRRPTSELSAASDCCTTSVEDQVAERAEFDVLLQDLRELAERQRSALVMRELSGLSHEEIALALGTSVGAAKQTIFEARRSLFEFAEGRAMACDEFRRTISDADGRALRSRRVRAHLRECPPCAQFAAAIPARSEDLRALVPALPALAGVAFLERIVGAGSAHGGRAVAGVAVGAAGKAASAGLAANALAGVAILASATVGVTVGVDKLVQAAGHGDRARIVAPAPPPAKTGASSRPSSSLVGRPAGQRALPARAPEPGARLRVGTASPARGRVAATSLGTRGSRSTPAGAGAGGPAAVPGRGGGNGHGAGAHVGKGPPPAGGRGGAAKTDGGTGRPAWAESGRPKGAGSGRPAWAGSGRPAGRGTPPAGANWPTGVSRPAGAVTRGGAGARASVHLR